MFGKSFKKEKYGNGGPEQARSGSIAPQISYMMAVPRNGEEAEDLPALVRRVQESPWFCTKETRMEQAGPVFTVEYHGASYEISLFAEPLDLPKLFTIQHKFTQEDFAAMQQAKRGVTTAMTFFGSALDSFHLQVKVLACLFPDLLGLVDFSAERILSGRWAKMAAESDVPPAPSYLYSGQAVGGENGCVWLHTHGLNRCGSIELEILDSDSEHYSDQFSVLQTVAGNIVTREKLGTEREPFWVGNTGSGGTIIGTWLSWQNAVKRYPAGMLGGLNDRSEGHNGAVGALYLYLTEKDFPKGKLSPVSALNAELADNPLMMISNEETDRMSRLAAERFSFFAQALQKPDVHCLIKFGMAVDEKHQKDGKGEREHLWFEAKSVQGDSVLCTLTQEPYYIASLHEGSELSVPLSRLTDWILYTPAGQITPDSVYLLEQ